MPAEKTNNHNLIPWLENLIFGSLTLGITLRLFISGSQAGPGINLFVSFFIWFAFCLWLIRRIMAGQLTIPHFGWGSLCLIVFAATVLASPYLAADKFSAFSSTVAWLTDLMLFGLILGLTMEGKNKAVYFLVITLIATAVVITAYAVYQYFYGLQLLRETVAQHPELIASLPAELIGDFFSRLNANEPFATFIYQNTLAGWLVLICPVLLGLIFDAFQRSSQIRKQFGWYLNIFFLLAMIFIIFTTGARGGLVALCLALFIFGLLAGWPYLKKFYRVLLSGILVLILVAIFIVFLIALFGQLPPPAEPGEAWASLQIRFGYWQGAEKVIRQNTWLGVGLNNFGSHYLQVKGALAGETSKAHNDFLQIWAELGILGLLGFLGCWLLILGKPIRQLLTEDKNIRPDLSENDPQPNYLIWAIIMGVGLAFVMSEMLNATFRLTDTLPWIFCLVFFLLWLGTFLLNHRLTLNSGTRYLRCGLVAGLVGLFIHSTVDFNWYSQGVSRSAWYLGGCLIALTTPLIKYRTLKIKTGFALKVFGLIPLVILLIAGGLWFIPRLMEAHNRAEAGREKVHLNSIDKIEEGVADLERAKKLNPYDVHPWKTLAWLYHRHRRLPLAQNKFKELKNRDRQRKVPDMELSLLNGEFHNCLTHIEKAITLKPRNAGLHSTRGMFYADHAKIIASWLEQLNDKLPATQLHILYDTARQESLRSFRKAYALYPTRPVNVYRLAQALENSQSVPPLPNSLSLEAENLYRLALDLNNRITRQALKLTPLLEKKVKGKLKASKKIRKN